MDLYTRHFRGRVLTIISDCSYSGSWVREAMAFMDEQGVGPCGHVAKEKGILVKVFSSCLAHEIPAELAFSIHGVRNSKTDGGIWFWSSVRNDRIYERQQSSMVDFTEVQCKNNINHPCTMDPGSTWQKWNVQKRIMVINSSDRERSSWCYLLLIDDEQIIRVFLNKVQAKPMTGNYEVNLSDYGQILKSGWGYSPPAEAKKWLEKEYFINYDY